MQIGYPPITTICFSAWRRSYDWSLLERRNAFELPSRAAETPAAPGEIRITRWQRRRREGLESAHFRWFFLIKSRFWFARSAVATCSSVCFERVHFHSFSARCCACAFIMSLSFSIRTEHHSVSRVADLEDREMRRAIPTLALSTNPTAPVHFQTFRREKFVLSLHLAAVGIQFKCSLVYPPCAEQAHC